MKDTIPYDTCRIVDEDEGEKMDIIYYNTRRIVDEGEIVITTNNPSKRFYGVCGSIDRKRYILAGVLITGAAELRSMDVTKRKDLEAFVEAVDSCLFFFPAGGIVYKLPIEKAEELRTSDKKIKMGVNKVRSLLDSVGMSLSGGLMTRMSFVPRGELSYEKKKE